MNWDLIPPNAIAQVNVEGSSPLFGLNALGGSVVVKLKDGFDYQGGEFVAYGGSYGRAGALFQYGAESQNASAYVALEAVHDHDFHDTAGSELRQFYGDLGWRNDKSEIHLSITADDNALGNPGATPEDLLSLDRAANSTAPNLARNQYVNVNLRGSYDIDDNTSVQGVAYYTNFSQRLTSGDTTDSVACGTILCEDDGVTPLTTPTGGSVPSSIAGPNLYSALSLEGIDSNAYGASAQVSQESSIFGHSNHLVAGASFDGAISSFNSATYFGGLTSNLWFIGPGYEIDQGDLSTAPVGLQTYDQYYGVFFTDRYELTDRLAATVSGRFNLADIALHDRLGTALSGNNQYAHFNPGVGLTYQLLPPLQLFGNFSEANRAPTPNELECSNPAIPCLLPSAYISDPSLKQVVARTVELGARGRLPDAFGGRFTWDADFFHTLNTDDIIYVSAINSTQGGFFQNAGDTLRQGFEATLTWKTQRVRATLGYTYTDATYQSAQTLNSPNNLAANMNGQIFVVPGDRLPLVPAQRANLTVDYDVTDRWTVGGTLIGASSQFLIGDDGNQQKPLGGYVIANLNTSYKVTDNIQLFGVIDNITNQRYNTYGTFVQVNLISNTFSNPRVYVPGPPVEAFGGVRVTF